MKILFISSAFNGMAQRLWIELDRLDYEVKVLIPNNEEEQIEAVLTFDPDIIVAPFLTVKIPSTIWKNKVCLIVHPGVLGDRGASSLDWAILKGEQTWGVTILQAADKMDAGDVWAYNEFQMRPVSKGALYRNEVTQAAAKGILQAITNFKEGNFSPKKLDYNNPLFRGRWNNKTTQVDFQFDWNESAEAILKKINAADSSPGVRIELRETDYYCFGACIDSELKGTPGEIIAIKSKAICVATRNESIWIRQLKEDVNGAIKLPATLALQNKLRGFTEIINKPFDVSTSSTWQEIRFGQEGEVGFLHFDFYNGAMGTEQCLKLKDAFAEAKKRVKLIVLMGGSDVWSNGIDLNVIEGSTHPEDESWANINAMDDLILEIIESTDHFVISALQGNAGAGGVALALAGDKVLARNGIVLNPHTKNMGLYGSEYWTYLLPKRIGMEKALKFTEECLPWGVTTAKDIGLIDDFKGETNTEFISFVKEQANRILSLSYFDKLLIAKKSKRRKDNMNKPLADYREEELAKMKLNFYEDDMGFKQKRHYFVHKIANAAGIENLYSSRRSIYRKRKWESISYKKK